VSKTYKIDYTSDSIHHRRFYNALNEDTARSMFLTDADIHHTDVDDESLLVEECCAHPVIDECECECHED